MTFPADWGIAIPLSRDVQIRIRVGIQEKIRTRPSCWVWSVVVVDCMRIEQLAGVEGVVPCLLKPYRQVVLVESLGYEFWVASCYIFTISISESMKLKEVPTIRRVDVSDISIVRVPARQQGHTRRATNGSGAVVSLIGGPLSCDILLQQRHIIQGVHVQVLVISQNEDNIWSPIFHQWLLLQRSHQRSQSPKRDGDTANHDCDMSERRCGKHDTKLICTCFL